MCLLCIPWKFKLFFFQAECKWRLITIKYCVVAEKSLAGNTGPIWTFMSPKSMPLQLLEETALPLAEGDTAFCCSRDEYMKLFSYHSLISLCCFCLVKGFLLFWKWRWNSARSLMTTTANPGVPFCRKSNCAYLHLGSARWWLRRVSLNPSWDSW